MKDYKDIYAKIGNYLFNNGWRNLDLEEQKEVLDQAFKMYIKSKIYEIRPDFGYINDNLQVLDLFNILAGLIDSKDYFDTLRYFSHYLLSIMSNMQDYEISWSDGVNNNQTIVIDILEGKWHNLSSSNEEDLADTFRSLYYAYQEYFFKKDVLIRRIEFKINK